MKIEVFGAGCPRCRETHQTLINAAAALNIPADISYITDVAAIAERGIVATPAVVIDGHLVMKGRVPTRREAEDLLRKYDK